MPETKAEPQSVVVALLARATKAERQRDMLLEGLKEAVELIGLDLFESERDEGRAPFLTIIAECEKTDEP